MNARVIDLDEASLRAIIREESDAFRKVMAILDQFPPVGAGVAAKALDVTPKTINVWRKSGKINCLDNGKILLSEIVRLKSA